MATPYPDAAVEAPELPPPDLAAARALLQSFGDRVLIPGLTDYSLGYDEVRNMERSKMGGGGVT